MQGLIGGGETHALAAGHGWSNGLDFGSEDVPLQRLVAHWINLPKLWPGQPVGSPIVDSDGFSRSARSWQATAGVWRIRLDSRADLDEVLAVCKRNRTFAITHVMEVRRTDGATFTGTQADQLLTILQIAVSFALGRWSCPAAPVGYTPDGKAGWSRWGPSHCDHPDLGSDRWWFEHRGQDLAETIEGFLRHWEDETRRQPLSFAATSAIIASGKGFVEQRLVTVTSALEHLCWVTQVLEGDVSERAFKKLDAHDRLRQLLTSMKVALNIDPVYLPALAAHAAGQDNCDGPRAVAQVRNELVHPKDTRALYDRPHLVSEAARLAARYLDLAILWRIGFTGETMDRTKLPGWVGDTEQVPWSSDPESG